MRAADVQSTARLRDKLRPCGLPQRLPRSLPWVQGGGTRVAVPGGTRSVHQQELRLSPGAAPQKGRSSLDDVPC